MSKRSADALHAARTEVLQAADAYIALRDSLNGHSSDEGKRLNAAVKALQKETMEYINHG